MDPEIFISLGIATGLGLLVGMQREWAAGDEVAGIRTFTLITLLGTVSARLSQSFGGWIIAAAMIGVAAIIIQGNLARYRQGHADVGVTTEIAALLMFAVGAALVLTPRAPAVAVGGAVAALLHWKHRLHGFVKEIGEKDFKGIIQLVLIALVILPVLPNKTYGPYDVLNPREIWLMVVLIVGISLGAYVAYKVLGSRVGSILGGVLGGFISSTATTVSYARQRKDAPDVARLAATVILIASTIVNIRILIEIGAVAPSLLRSAAAPLGIMTGLMAALCVVLLIRSGREGGEIPPQSNPAQLKAALIFGGLYAVIIFVVAAVKEHFGEQALYAVAVISGLTDVDAMTLSTAQLYSSGRVSDSTAWRVILLASLANLVFKAGAVAVLGGKRLFLHIAITFGISIAGGVILLLLWP